MARVTREDVRSLKDYEEIRESFRKRVIEARKQRRVQVGDRLSLSFENHETVLFQIQEMMRAERITKPEAIQTEVDVYNELLPDRLTLSATLFIEITEKALIKPELDRFQGLDRDDRLYLEIGGTLRIPAQFEPGHSTEDRISAVHYVRFPLGEEGRRRFLAGSPAELVVHHPHYHARANLDEATRYALAEDLMHA